MIVLVTKLTKISGIISFILRIKCYCLANRSKKRKCFDCLLIVSICLALFVIDKVLQRLTKKVNVNSDLRNQLEFSKYLLNLLHDIIYANLY